MNKITKILLGLCFVVFVLNGCGNVEKLKNDNAQHSVLPDEWTMTETIAEQPARFPVVQDFKKDDLVEYKPEPFKGIGTLSNKWELQISEKDGIFPGFDFSEYLYIDFMALVDGWCLKSRYPADAKEWASESYLLDPANGSIKQSLVRFGATDGEVVWVDDYCDDCVEKSLCWHIDKGDIWIADDYNPSEGLFRNNYFHISNDNLFFVDIHSWNRLFYNALSLINPWTGEILWKLNADYRISNLYSIESSDYLFIECYDRQVIFVDNLPQNTFVPYFYSLNMTNLMVNEVFENGYFQMFSTDKNLFAYNGVNLLRLTQSLDQVEETIPIGEDLRIICDDRNIYNNTAENYFLVEDEEFLDSSDIFLISLKDGERRSLDYQDSQIVNHSLVVANENRIQALNPSTLEPTWWINLEEEDLGENPRVIWCDFRGVLVMSDTKLVCFTSE